MANVTPQSGSRAIARVLPGAVSLLALGLLALGALPLLRGAQARLAALLRYPYPHDGLEGTLLHESRLLWSGQPLYQPLERFRFVSAPYPPLHPLILGLVAGIAGPHVFWGGRLLSLAAALGVTALLVLSVRRAGGSWLGGLIGASLFLSAPPLLLWATRVKPDLTSLLFTSLGLYLASRPLAAENQEPKIENRTPARLKQFLALSPWCSRWPLVAICFVLAFFTKQTDVAAPLAVGLALLLGDLRAYYGAGARAGYLWRLPLRWRTFIYGLVYFALALGIWALLDTVTAGQYSAHVWGLHRSEWWSAALAGKFVMLLLPYWPALLIALAVIVRAIRSERALVPACYALVAPISLLGAAETGANHNHLLECLLALALMAGIGAGWMAELIRGRAGSACEDAQSAANQLVSALRGRAWGGQKSAAHAAPPTRKARIFAALLFTVLALQIALAYRPQEWYLNELAPKDAPEHYLSFIRTTPGEILADDVGLLYAAGRPLRYDDPSTMGPAATSHVWDQSGLLQEIDERHFSAILLPVDLERSSIDATGRWTPAMLAAIRAHYRLKYRDTIFVYVPN